MVDMVKWRSKGRYWERARSGDGVGKRQKGRAPGVVIGEVDRKVRSEVTLANSM